MSLRTLAIAVLLTSALGCRATSPVAVMDSAVEMASPAPEAEVDADVEARRTPRIVRAEARMGGHALHVRLVLNVKASSFRERWMAQLYLNTDRTGPLGMTTDFAGRLIESTPDGRFPVRRSCYAADCHDPDPASGGWGEIVGYGTYQLHGHELRVKVPLSVLDDYDGLDLGVMLSDGEGSTLENWYTTVLPHGRGHVVERGSVPAPRRL